MWWGRSPEASSLVALTAAVLEFSEETVQEGMILLANVASGNKDALDIMQSRLMERSDLPAVWDAFSGFGGIPIAAGRLGLKSYANDLNPVAAVLTKAAVDIPARFAAVHPVHTGPAKQATYSGAEGLAEDVQFYGEWMESRAQELLLELYPQTQNGKLPFAWLWVRTVKCPNPACSCKIPLGSSFVLSTSKTSQCWAEPVVEAESIRFEIHNGKCPDDRVSNKISSRGAKFRCPVCGEITTDAYVKRMGSAHELGAEIMAVVTNTDGKKSFFEPDKIQKKAAGIKEIEDVPPGAIPANAHWFTPPGFGITEYADLFTHRQMLMLTTFSNLVGEAQNMVTAAALAAGMEEGTSLAAGGTGAVAYGQAVGVYLAFVVDKMADYNSAMCSWRTSGENVRSTFGRQAIPMVWTFAEGNPFSNVSGSFKSMLNGVVESVRKLSFTVPAIVTQDNAVTMNHPQNTMICTELPYYRDIGYADLSDFFYVWLRRSLKETYPQIFAPIVSSKEELSTVSTYFGVPVEEAENKYRTDMKTVCNKLYQCSNVDYPALLFYCFRKNDLESIRREDNGSNISAWEFMLESLLDVGFAITAVWPMRSEPVSDKADSTRVLIVVRKGVERKGQVTRRRFINTLMRELPVRIQLLLNGHISPEDELLSYMGQGLRIFSQYQKVLNADGSAMCLHDALQAIYQECMSVISQRNEIVPD